MTTPKVVTFDFWNTLIREDTSARDRRVDAWLGLLEGEGIALEREQLGAAFKASWRAFETDWRANRVTTTADAVDNILRELDLKPPDDVRDGLLTIYTHPAPEHHPQPTDHIADALEALRSAGVRIGIICDVGLAPSPTLRSFLDGHGLLGFFDHWSFSDEVGSFKPHPTIFRHALAGLGGMDPADAAHIGDLRRTDIAGAQRMGMTAVRYTGVFDDPGSAEDGTESIEADAVIADHADLPAVLGF